MVCPSPACPGWGTAGRSTPGCLTQASTGLDMEVSPSEASSRATKEATSAGPRTAKTPWTQGLRLRCWWRLPSPRAPSTMCPMRRTMCSLSARWRADQSLQFSGTRTETSSYRANTSRWFLWKNNLFDGIIKQSECQLCLPPIYLFVSLDGEKQFLEDLGSGEFWCWHLPVHRKQPGRQCPGIGSAQGGK